MHNQHAGLSQALAEQRITERHEQADHARLVDGARPPRRRRWRLGRGWWQLARWPGVAATLAARRPPTQGQVGEAWHQHQSTPSAKVTGLMREESAPEGPGGHEVL